MTSDGRLLRQASPTPSTTRTVDDPSSADDTPRTFAVVVRSSEADLSSSSTMITVRPTIRTVSDAISADSSPVCDTDWSSSPTSVVVCDVQRTSSDRVTTDQDIDVDEGQSSGHSETSAAAVWVEDSGDVELSDTVACSDVIEMTDITRRGPPSLIARCPVTTSRPPSVLRPLSSHPDVFYTGSCLQVRLHSLLCARIKMTYGIRLCEHCKLTKQEVKMSVSQYQDA